MCLRPSVSPEARPRKALKCKKKAEHLRTDSQAAVILVERYKVEIGGRCGHDGSLESQTETRLRLKRLREEEEDDDGDKGGEGRGTRRDVVLSNPSYDCGLAVVYLRWMVQAGLIARRRAEHASLPMVCYGRRRYRRRFAEEMQDKKKKDSKKHR